MSQKINDSDSYRVGFSKDIHRLGENRKLMLGGVHVPYHLGEIAHSDGDVVYHALAEAILGALALGDLGHHFPDNDPSTTDMDSSVIMKHVLSLMRQQGYEMVNADISIIIEKPKLKDYITLITKSVASTLEVEEEQVSIKAGTNEKIGEVGEGVAAVSFAAVLLRKTA